MVEGNYDCGYQKETGDVTLSQWNVIMQALVLELNPSDSLVIDSVESPVYRGDNVVFIDGDAIQQAVWDSLESEWVFTGVPLIH